MADFIEIVESLSRDGIQNELKLLDSDQKIALIERSIDAGLRRVEVTSFVNPKRVPQMADADAVAAKLPKSSDTRFIGLTLNRRGLSVPQQPAGTKRILSLSPLIALTAAIRASPAQRVSLPLQRSPPVTRTDRGRRHHRCGLWLSL